MTWKKIYGIMRETTRALVVRRTWNILEHCLVLRLLAPSASPREGVHPRSDDARWLLRPRNALDTFRDYHFLAKPIDCTWSN